jgi:hypothetical protein
MDTSYYRKPYTVKARLKASCRQRPESKPVYYTPAGRLETSHDFRGFAADRQRLPVSSPGRESAVRPDGADPVDDYGQRPGRPADDHLVVHSLVEQGLADR